MTNAWVSHSDLFDRSERPFRAYQTRQRHTLVHDRLHSVFTQAWAHGNCPHWAARIQQMGKLLNVDGTSPLNTQTTSSKGAAKGKVTVNTTEVQGGTFATQYQGDAYAPGRPVHTP